MAASAVPVGFMAGLFGIGGGLITVPVLFYIFNSIGLDQSFIMHLAVGTSFAIIIPTSISSVMTHMKYKAVDFNVVKGFLNLDISKGFWFNQFYKIHNISNYGRVKK